MQTHYSWQSLLSWKAQSRKKFKNIYKANKTVQISLLSLMRTHNVHVLWSSGGRGYINQIFSCHELNFF